MSEEALKLALEALEEAKIIGGQRKADKAITALLEALAEQPAQQEPAAWRVKVETTFRDGSVDIGYQVRNEKMSSHDEPLYTSPQPAQQEPVARYKEKCADGSRCLHGCLSSEACYTSPQPAQRKPLTDEQIEALAKALEARGDTLRQFARAIEAAHGIKENT